MKRELEKLLKDFDSAIAEIKEIDRKVKARVKSAVLEGEKIDKVSAKALMTKIPDSPEKTIERLLNIQKNVARGSSLVQHAILKTASQKTPSQI
ncbi:hypothetical protein DSO57_1007194 [Entomophthora muscae]|uniref:Uncharacterized protein n=1 Tax=Entomophthora muscae TaxID=34485 RepID=A0ACC2SWC5_9FUNG|nr:hypothetical protein DSO57_1007194 [Entomophthora muscae]